MNKCILLCAGSSDRFGENKLLFSVEGAPVVKKTLLQILSAEIIDEVIVVVPKGDKELEKLLFHPKTRFVAGGKTRFLSAYNGLKACGNCDVVVIHDGARCFVGKDLIERCILSAKEFGTGIAAIKTTDTVRKLQDGILLETLDRNTLARVQTPQAFSYEKIFRAYENAFAKYGEDAPYTDDSTVFGEFFGECRMVCGSEKNIKITYREDVADAPLFGIGYDVHKTCDGEGIVLCGAQIPCDKKIIAHSDGDVPVHALADAILTALGKRDIGHYFPDTDDKYLGISSLSLLKEVIEISKDEGKKVSSASIAIICESPRLSPYIAKMKKNLAEILCVGEDKIGISATTNEGVGELGKGEAIASYATVVLIK